MLTSSSSSLYRMRQPVWSKGLDVTSTTSPQFLRPRIGYQFANGSFSRRHHCRGSTGRSTLSNWGKPPLSFLPPPFPSLSLPFSLLLPPLRSRRLKYSYRGLRSAVSSPSGVGWSPSENRSYCILALKSDIWWHQFY